MLLRLSNHSGLKVRGKFIATDSETTGLMPWGESRRVAINYGSKAHPHYRYRTVVPARPFVWSFCDMDGNTDYLRADVNPMTRAVTWAEKDLKKIKSVWEDDTITKIGHNIRYDLFMAEASGIKPRGKIIDTQVVAHIATSGQELTYALKQLCKRRFKYPDDDEKALLNEVTRQRQIAKKKGWAIANAALAGKDPKKADMWLTSDKFLKPYAVGDVIRAMLIYMGWYEDVMSDPRTREVCEREHELFWVLKDMEQTGTRVFRPRVNKLIKFYKGYQAKQQKVADVNGGKGLNFKSNPQMGKVFYEDRGHLPSYTGTYNHKQHRFNYSTNGDAILRMANGYVIQPDEWFNIERKTDKLPIGAKWVRKKVGDEIHRYIRVPPDPLAKAMLEKNAAGQTNSAFLYVYKRFWVKESPGVWVLHPGYKQTGAITGRLSCSDPNLQQVASETTGRRKADIQSRPREAFGPRPGTMWYLPDYSQIEVWLFAWLSGEKSMQKKLLSGQDYHGGIAKQVFGDRADFDEHKDYYRKCAKLIMFCKLYGGGVPKVAKLLKSDFATAQEFVADYEAKLPGVKKFMKELIAEATAKGEIFSPFGRRYTFEATYAYRAVNYLIQGTAADVMKNGLINIQRMLKRTKWYRLGVRLLLTVHDEVIIELPIGLHSIELMKDVIRAMQEDSERLGLPVLLPVEMKIAKTRWSRPTKIVLPPSIVGGAPKKIAA